MQKKVKDILSSLRFWIVTLTAVVAILEAWAGGTLQVAFVFDTIKIWLGVVAGIGTLDSVATKFSLATTSAGVAKKK